MKPAPIGRVDPFGVPVGPGAFQRRGPAGPFRGPMTDPAPAHLLLLHRDSGPTPDPASAPAPNPLRRLVAFVLRNPGCSIHRACTDLGLPRARLLRHLHELEKDGVVVRLGKGQRTALVSRVDGIEQHADQLRALADPNVRQLYEWLHALGRTRPKDLIQVASGSRGWARATVQWRLALLVEAGLAERCMDGRLRPVPVAPPVAQAFQAAAQRSEAAT